MNETTRSNTRAVAAILIILGTFSMVISGMSTLFLFIGLLLTIFGLVVLATTIEQSYVRQFGSVSSLFLEWREDSLSTSSMFYEFPLIKKTKDYPLEYFYLALAEAFQNSGFMITKDPKKNFLLSEITSLKDVSSSTSFEAVIHGEERISISNRANKPIKATLLLWGIYDVSEQNEHEKKKTSTLPLSQNIKAIRLVYSLKSSKGINEKRVKNLFNALYYNLSGVLNLAPQDTSLTYVSDETYAKESFIWDKQGILDFKDRFPIVKYEKVK